MKMSDAWSRPCFSRTQSRLPGWWFFRKQATSVNLEEPDLFNQAVGDFLARVDVGNWLPRDPRSRAPKRPA